MLRNGLLALILLTSTLAATPSGSPVGPETRSAIAKAGPQSPSNAEELAALKTDTEKMRVTLNQMKQNLAFVQTTQTPLKHQFDLEIDMWQLLLEQMDRRVSKMEQAGKEGH
jgi:hypothetical protein